MSYKQNHAGAQPTQQKLVLDQEDGWLFGVCAGLADYLRLDVSVVRVATVIGALFTPKIVIAVYLVAWLVLDDRVSWQRRQRRR